MKKITILAWFLLLSVICNAQADFKNKYMGVQYKDVEELNDFKKINITVINLHFGVTHVKTYHDKHALLVSRFENSVNTVDDFQLRVVDVVEIPKFNENYYCISMGGCFENGKKDPTLFALAKKEYGADLTNIVKVWKLDKGRGKLMDYPKTGIRCHNQQGYVMNN